MSTEKVLIQKQTEARQAVLSDNHSCYCLEYLL